MTYKTQKQIIRDKLQSTGLVTRNWCLRRYISRLSARIMDLREEGFDIVGERGKGKQKGDYIYKLTTK